MTDGSGLGTPKRSLPFSSTRYVNRFVTPEFEWAPSNESNTQIQFGDAVAYYFAFLSSYTTALIFPTVIGLLCHVFSAPYSPTYSILLLLWSTTYTEWWRVHERILALRWGTTNSYLVEKRRAQYRKEGGAAGATGPVSESRIEGGNGWWKREVKILASVPIIMAFSMILFLLLTAIFVLEAFVAQLYTGPGQKLIVSSFRVAWKGKFTPPPSLH